LFHRKRHAGEYGDVVVVERSLGCRGGDGSATINQSSETAGFVVGRREGADGEETEFFRAAGEGFRVLDAIAAYVADHAKVIGFPAAAHAS